MVYLSLMKKRWASLIIVLSLGIIISSSKVYAADEITSTQVDSETVVTTVISEEVGAFDGTTGIKRQDQQQAFDKADTLDQSWQNQAAELKTPESNLSLVVDHVTPTDAQNFEFRDPVDSTHAISVTAENVDMKDISNLNDLGTKSSTGYQYQPKLDLPGSGANTYNGDTMQDFAPIPRKYAGQYYTNESQNGFGDQNSYRNGLRLTFSEAINNFGVWVGDVETRTDGEGTPALLRLYDSSLNLILEQVINPNNIHTDGDQNQAICGTTNTTTSLINTTGCGHNTTRYIGFTSNMPVVKTMLIIVGDDDAFPGTDENNGNTEHISFMAPSMMFFTPKTTPNFTSVLSLCDGQDATSSNRNFCLNLSLAQDVQGDLTADDFDLTFSSGYVELTSILKYSNNFFRLSLDIAQNVDFEIPEIFLSLRPDVIARIGNNLSTNLQSNTLNLSYVQTVDPVDPINPADPIDPVDPTNTNGNQSVDLNKNNPSEVSLLPAESALKTVAQIPIQKPGRLSFSLAATGLNTFQTGWLGILSLVLAVALFAAGRILPKRLP